MFYDKIQMSTLAFGHILFVNVRQNLLDTMVDHYTFASLDERNNSDSNVETAATTTMRNGGKRTSMEPFDMEKVFRSSCHTPPFTKKIRTSYDANTLTSIVTCDGEVSICVCISVCINKVCLCHGCWALRSQMMVRNPHGSFSGLFVEFRCSHLCVTILPYDELQLQLR
jgi:hypothetical protein